MYWHIILTEKCNMQCRYCYEKSMKEFDNGLKKKWKFDFNVPCETQLDIQKLKEFILKDKDPMIIFYGGEPLLKINKIKEIINALGDNARYGMQTNGKLLHLLPKECINKFSRILISIDGNKDRTDYNREKGIYNKVLENINLIRDDGYKGEIIARMTIVMPDLLEQVSHLISLAKFDSIHWQLDMGFYKNDFVKSKVKWFVKEYNESLTELINLWVNQMKKENVMKIYPFLGIFESLYYNKPTPGIRCGAGHSGFAITTKGEITTCPIMNNVKDFYVGNITNSNPQELKEIKVGEPCASCNDLDICRGRCLYANKAKLWPPEGEELICQTIKHLIKEIKRVLPTIKDLIKNKKIKESDFEYEKYFGPEIIP